MGAVLGLVLELAGTSARQAAGRAARASVWLLLALLSIAVGFAGFVAALWIVLGHRVDPVSAALIMGFLGLVLAGTFALIARARMRGPQQVVALREVEAALQAMMKEDDAGVWTPVLTVALVGFLITRRR